MSARHDEHGPVERADREHGPEWWAMAAEFCECGHHVDEHHQFNLGTPQYFAGACMVADPPESEGATGYLCLCSAFRGQP